MSEEMTGDVAVAGARTVLTVAEQFERLKQAAGMLSNDAASSDRGYFTPSEDEEVRHMLVSYWQSRNALLELVLEMKDQQQVDAHFLVGYAGALVLVDAARFLYDEFDDRPAVRGKLNEPAPHFGIPGGLYDTVQASRASPVHMWHLYHATKYFTEHHDALVGVSLGTPLEDLPELIENLQGASRISLARFAVLRARVRARHLVDLVKQDLLDRALYGLQKSVSSAVADIYTVRDHKPGLSDEIVGQLRGLLRPGDVLIVRKEHALTNYFLPGYWPHAALYLGTSDELAAAAGFADHEHVRPHWDELLNCDPDEPSRVHEAMKDGVRIRSLRSAFGSDAIAVLRPKLAQEDIFTALARGMFHTGKSYDFDFDFTRADRLVCTEVVYRSYEGVGEVQFELARRAGRMTLSAEDLIGMAIAGDHFNAVATYAPPLYDEIQTGTAAAEALKATASSL
jgi:hypothetical protein